MALGDGIRRNIASVDPAERALLRDALLELNRRFFPGNRNDAIPGGVSWWFKQDEIHQATHVHGGPEFLPWHREIVNRLEEMLRQINPQLSLHYWDWTQDPRTIPNANLGGGRTGTLNLFTTDFMGYGGSTPAPIGEPWLSAGYYVPGAVNFRSTDPFDPVNNNPADPPREVIRFVSGSPATVAQDNEILAARDYPQMSLLLESVHNRMHGFVNMGGTHTSFRDPFVFLLHSNVDRLFSLWQTDSGHPERLDPDRIYGSDGAVLDDNIRPWSGVPPTIRPWAPPENQQVAKTYKHPSVVAPPRYDTLAVPQISLFGSISFGNVPQRDIRTRSLRISNRGSALLSLSIQASPPPPQGQPLSGFRWRSFTGEILPGQSLNFLVDFSPRAEGSFTSTLRVVSNASGSPHSVRLSGRGLPREVQPQ